jgi:hypothetical protein
MQRDHTRLRYDYKKGNHIDEDEETEERVLMCKKIRCFILIADNKLKMKQRVKKKGV